MQLDSKNGLEFRKIDSHFHSNKKRSPKCNIFSIERKNKLRRLRYFSKRKKVLWLYLQRGRPTSTKVIVSASTIDAKMREWLQTRSPGGSSKWQNFECFPKVKIFFNETTWRGEAILMDSRCKFQVQPSPICCSHPIINMIILHINYTFPLITIIET